MQTFSVTNETTGEKWSVQADKVLVLKSLDAKGVVIVAPSDLSPTIETGEITMGAFQDQLDSMKAKVQSEMNDLDQLGIAHDQAIVDAKAEAAAGVVLPDPANPAPLFSQAEVDQACATVKAAAEAAAQVKLDQAALDLSNSQAETAAVQKAFDDYKAANVAQANS